MSRQDAKPVFYIVPHTHWEGAVFKTREEYLEMGLPNILRALALLKQHPSYRFTLDQACYVKPFLERYPEAVAAFRRLVNEGRLAIVGGTNVMLDDNMPGGESFVRQVLYGKRFFRQTLGVDVRVGWLLDTFGHHAQLPQLLKLAGLDTFWFFRGVPSWQTPSEFEWEGLDGTRVRAFWLPHSYALAYGSPSTLKEFAEFMRNRWEMLDEFSSRRCRVGLCGADVSPPEVHLPSLVEAFNRLPEAPFELRLATPQEYEKAVARDELPVLRGELNPIFQGTYSSRIRLKQWMHDLETKLTTAEKLDALLTADGLPALDQRIQDAWEPVLFSQAHDLMSGVMTDRVWEDTVRALDHARRIVDEELEAQRRLYSSRVNTHGEGVPVIVFNSLGWARTDIVNVKISFAETGVTGVRVLDAEGQEVPIQLLSTERLDNGDVIAAEVAFLARDVPALGHSVYRAIPLSGEQVPPISCCQVTEITTLENELLRVSVNPLTGAITQITEKESGWSVLRAPGNVVVQEQDHGDLWELYHPLDGGSRIAVDKPHPVAPRGKALYSDEQVGEKGRVTRGPVFSELLAEHPFGDRGTFSTRVRVYAGLSRIEVHTQVLNYDEFVRYRAFFPTSLCEGHNVHEIPFGAIERPAGIEFPAQMWVDWSDGKCGLALLNRGLPGNAVLDGTLLLSLCRSTRIVAYGFGGGYEPGMSSDTGLEIGERLSFDYALLPHQGDWRTARVYLDGLAFNNPLIAWTSDLHAGKLPSRWGFLEVEPHNVVLSALKVGEDGGLVLRVYEASGQHVPQARVSLAVQLGPVREVNLVEDPIGVVPAKNGAIEFSLRPFEIKTLKLG